jgi:curved DNA-binding protein CbpA
VTHYETLGVPRDASPADIKAAWRRASSAAHPDREGGSTEAQTAVNRAYEVLGDDERRAAYDASGSDQQAISLEEEARQLLARLFGQVIDGGAFDPISDARQILLQSRAQLGAQCETVKQKTAKLVGLRSKISTKGDAPNIAHGIIDSQLEGFNRLIAQIERGDKVHEAASAMLDAYEFSGAQPESSNAMFMQGFEQAFFRSSSGWR